MTPPNAPQGEVGTVAQVSGVPPLNGRGGWRGFIADAEHVPELKWPESVRWYERMLYTDARIESGYQSLMQPLGDYVWALDRNGAEQGATDLFAADIGLPVGMPGPEADDDFYLPPGRFGFSFLKHLEETLLAPALGHYFFETVYEFVDGWDRLTALAPRSPGTLMEIVVAPNGDLVGIRQNFSKQQPTAGGPLAMSMPPLIDANRLIPYVWRGDARAKWLGRPMLRSLYRHWLVKDTLIRVDAINHDRAGGVPVVETDQTFEGDVTDLASFAQAMRVSEDGGGALPPGAKMVPVRVGGTDVIASVKYHDEQLASVWEDQVGQLGQTQTGGNRALGQTFAGLQTLARRSVARWFASEFRERVIRQWFSYNVGETIAGEPAPYPKLVFRPRREVQGAVEQQAPAPAQQPPPQQEAPPPNPPQAAPAPPSPLPSTGAVAGEEAPRRDRRGGVGAVRSDRGEDAGAAGAGAVATEATPVVRSARRSSHGAMASWEGGQDAERGNARAEAPPMSGASLLQSEGIRLPARQLRRQPYDFEVRAAVDFAQIDTAYATVVGQIHDLFARKWLPAQMAELRDAILYTATGKARSRITAADMAKIAATPTGAEELADLLFTAAEQGANGAYAELAAQGIEAREAAEGALRAAVKDHAQAIAQQTADGLSLAAARKAVQVSAGRDALAVASEVEAYLGGLKHQWERDQLAGAVQQAQNAGRFEVFGKVEPKLTFYASELLDAATCDACSSVDGSTYGSLGEAMQDYPGGGYFDCAGGPRCRGTVVAVDAEA